MLFHDCMGRLFWTEGAALRADINSAVGALKAHRREVLEIHAPEAAQQEENAEDRSRREADQFRAFVAERRRLREEGE